MLTTAAGGLEPLACCPFPGGRSATVKAGGQCRVDWSEARHFGRDTLSLEIAPGQLPGKYDPPIPGHAGGRRLPQHSKPGRPAAHPNPDQSLRTGPSNAGQDKG